MVTDHMNHMNLISLTALARFSAVSAVVIRSEIHSDKKQQKKDEELPAHVSANAPWPLNCSSVMARRGLVSGKNILGHGCRKGLGFFLTWQGFFWYCFKRSLSRRCELVLEARVSFCTVSKGRASECSGLLGGRVCRRWEGLRTAGCQT